MINEVLNTLQTELNVYFRTKLNPVEDKVIVSAIINQDGTIAINGENKIVMTLVNVNEAMQLKNTPPSGINTRPPANVDLTILLSGYFAPGNYTEALRFISLVMDFFHEKNVFTATNTPHLNACIEKITAQLMTMTTEELYHLWATLGAKYMPSVVYKLQVLSSLQSSPHT